ncbi:MAG TPA: DUF302 domain-containing protein [Gammaproteobacteria bacterium]|jgi:uncharacterized protein (DUF302 family)|nr:DUF302 domain-containing protein [Gammaproteobacteria bacterium]
MKRRILMLLAVLVFQYAQSVAAEEIIMTRSTLPFPEAMLALQESIREHGYTVSRVQRIDVGLTGMGYKTDKYRIVFAGKIDEIREMTRRSPQLAAYLPPKISIFAENGHTVLVSMNPEIFAEIAGDAVDPVIFDRWSSDLRSIFHDVNTAN